MHKADSEWKEILTPEQYRILREKGTEPAFSGELLENKESGMYTCVACGNELFLSDAKFESGSGWPSFWQALDKDRVELRDDSSHGIRRIEVTCARCGGHLGHLFDDAPQTPTGQRYCINSASLKFKKRDNS